MKKFIALLFSVCLVLGFSSCNGDDVNPVESTTEEITTQAPVAGEGDYYKYLEYSDHVELTEYKKHSTYVSLPSQINGKPVTSFGKIFYGNLTLVTVIIPSTYTEIVPDAFYNAHKLANLTIESGSLTTIGANAFYGCQSLKNANIPATVTDIHDDAFKFCTELIVYGASGSAAEEFCSKYSSIYFRATDVKTEEESGSEPEQENSTAEAVSEEESSTVEESSSVEASTAE